MIPVADRAIERTHGGVALGEVADAGAHVDVAGFVELFRGALEPRVRFERLDGGADCKLHVFAALGAKPREGRVAVSRRDPRGVGLEREIRIAHQEEAVTERRPVCGGEPRARGAKARHQGRHVGGSWRNHAEPEDADASRC